MTAYTEDPFRGNIHSDLTASLDRLEDAERQLKKRLENAARDREELDKPGIIHAMQVRQEKEIEAIRRGAANEVRRLEEALESEKGFGVAERERLEAEYKQETAALEARHAKVLETFKKTANSELSRLQQMIQALKIQEASVRDLSDASQSQAMAALQARVEKEMSGVRETAAIQINQLSAELKSSLQTIELLRKENSLFAQRPSSEEMERLRSLNASLVGVIAGLKTEQERANYELSVRRVTQIEASPEVSHASVHLTALQDSLERERVLARDERDRITSVMGTDPSQRHRAKSV